MPDRCVTIYCSPGALEERPYWTWEMETQKKMDAQQSVDAKRQLRDERALEVLCGIVATAANLRLQGPTLAPKQVLPSASNVKIIFDEMGGHPLLLRALCSMFDRLQHQIKIALDLDQRSSVFIVAVGTGTDGTTNEVGSVASKFRVQVVGAATPEQRLRAMFRKDDAGETYRDVHHAIFEGTTAAADTARRVLCNSRCAALLAVEASRHAQFAVKVQGDSKDLPATSVEALLPGWLIDTALQFKYLNGLRHSTIADAEGAGVAALGVAWRPFWVRSSTADFARLGTRLGMLTDNARRAQSHTTTIPPGFIDILQGKEQPPLLVGTRQPRYSASGAQVAMYQMRYGTFAPRADSNTFECIAADHAAMSAAMSRACCGCFEADATRPNCFRVKGMLAAADPDGGATVPALLEDAAAERLPLSAAERGYWELRAALHVPAAQSVAHYGCIDLCVTGHLDQPAFLAGGADFVEQLLQSNTPGLSDSKALKELGEQTRAFVQLRHLRAAARQAHQSWQAVATQQLAQTKKAGHANTSKQATAPASDNVKRALDLAHRCDVAIASIVPGSSSAASIPSVSALIDEVCGDGSKLSAEITTRVKKEQDNYAPGAARAVQFLSHMRDRIVNHRECVSLVNGRGAPFADAVMLALGRVVLEQLKLVEEIPINDAMASDEFRMMGAEFKEEPIPDAREDATEKAKRNAKELAQRATLAGGRLAVELLKWCCAATADDVAAVNVARFLIGTQTPLKQPSPTTPGQQEKKPRYAFGGYDGTCFVLDANVPAGAASTAQNWLFSPLSPISMSEICKMRDASKQGGVQQNTTFDPKWRLQCPPVATKS